MKSVPYRRMAILVIGLGSALTPITAAHTQPKGEVFIINTNDFSKGDIRFDVHGKWIGIWESKNQYWATSVKVNPPIYKIVNQDSDDLPERSSPSLYPRRAYIFCIKGLSWPNRKITKVPSADIIDSKVSLYAKGKFRSLTFNLETTSKSKDSPGGHLLLTVNQQTQMLSDYFCYFTLLWAGDIDGDGKLDFVISDENDNGGNSISLYLSTFAKPGELVGFAAVCGSSGC